MNVAVQTEIQTDRQNTPIVSYYLLCYSNGTDNARNLAIINRSRVCSAQHSNNSKFSEEGEFFTGEEAYGTQVVAAAAGSIKFSMG